MGRGVHWTTYSLNAFGEHGGYEAVYLKSYQSVTQAVEGIKAYMHFYNQERIHQALNYNTPAAVYAAGKTSAHNNT